MSPPVLLVSPHPDDLAWSLGGTVARLAAAEVPLSAVTLFTRTTYAPGSPAHGDAGAASLVRAEEDARWAALTGVALERFDLPDASLRGYTDDTEMGAPPAPAIVAEVAARLSAAVAAVCPQWILVPLAVGGHVDHAAVRQAVALLPGVPDVLWYEDLPYAAGCAGEFTAHPVLVEVDRCWAATEAGVRCYPSQEPAAILPEIRRHRAAVSGERLWAPTHAAADAFRQTLTAEAPKRLDLQLW